MSVKRRAFIGVTSLGAVASAVVSASGQANYGGEYERDGYGQRVRPNMTVGIGRGQAASMSVVWIPGPGREQAPPVKARFVLFGVGGEVLAEKDAHITPFAGAAVDYELPKQMKRQQVFGYVFIEGYEGELVNELFGGLEIYDPSSGRANIVGIVLGLG